MPENGSWLAPGELARRSGVALSALRFYEQQGLLSAARSPAGQRRYARETLRRVAFIRASQQLGISLAEIRDALQTLPEQRTPTKADWTRLSRRWRARLDARIAALSALRDRLDGCIGCGCLSLKACALWNPDDRLGDEGSGAQRLAPGESGASAPSDRARRRR